MEAAHWGRRADCPTCCRRDRPGPCRTRRVWSPPASLLWGHRSSHRSARHRVGPIRLMSSAPRKAQVSYSTSPSRPRRSPTIVSSMAKEHGHRQLPERVPPGDEQPANSSTSRSWSACSTPETKGRPMPSRRARTPIYGRSMQRVARLRASPSSPGAGSPVAPCSAPSGHCPTRSWWPGPTRGSCSSGGPAHRHPIPGGMAPGPSEPVEYRRLLKQWDVLEHTIARQWKRDLRRLLATRSPSAPRHPARGQPGRARSSQVQDARSRPPRPLLLRGRRPPWLELIRLVLRGTVSRLLRCERMSLSVGPGGCKLDGTTCSEGCRLHGAALPLLLRLPP